MEKLLLDIILRLIDIKYHKFKELLEFYTDFNKKLNEEKAKLPYNINILDEVHANENAHSRILVKLLCFEFNRRFYLLEDLLKSLGKPFHDIKIESPEITAEKNRIDARIRLKSSVIIIENKIHGAVEQKHQVDRYIDNEMDYLKNIYDDHNERYKNLFVLYITKEGGSPSSYSLSDENKSRLENRFKAINYRDDILNWLNNINLENFEKDNNKIILLNSALIQYKDYLNGQFFYRKGEIEMSNEIIKLLEDQFKINKLGSFNEKIEKINEIKRYALDLYNYLTEHEDFLFLEKLGEFEKKVQNTKFKGIEKIEVNKKFGEKFSSIMLYPSDWKEQYSIGISFNNKLGQLFYGINNANNDSSDELQKTFSEKIDQNNDPNSRWPFGIWESKEKINNDFIYDLENGTFFSKFERIIKNILEKTTEIKEMYR